MEFTGITDTALLKVSKLGLASGYQETRGGSQIRCFPAMVRNDLYTE